ncbi:cytochrome P450 [Agrocybe pediades]|nr:cytochrome P450 [Agrocybe pediades]
MLSLAILTTIAVLCLAAAVIQLWIQRIYHHALSKYPGPRLAAFTTWYRAYYDILMDGAWAQHLESLHEQYDPRAYNDIYGMGTRHTKQREMYRCFSTDLSVFAMSDHHEAMQRRNLIGPFFSRRAILALERTVQGKPANLDLAFRSASLEVITAYCFAQSSSSQGKDLLDFDCDILRAIDQTLPMIWVFKHFPLIKTLLLGVPECFASVLKPSTKGILEQRKQMGAQIDEIMKDPSSLQNVDHETIYHHFLTPQPDSQRHPPVTRDWLLDEGLYLRFAGSDTVGNTCTVAAYHILENRDVHRKLSQALKEAWPDKDLPPSYEVLEKLPYLTAVIKESLRMAHGVVSPLPRIVGPSDSEIAGEIIPTGTVVSMGACMVHKNAEIFPDPMAFKPERWLAEGSAELEKYLVSFSKGPRGCLGINLAMCELYLLIGTIFRKLDLVPDKPTYVSLDYQCSIPLTRLVNQSR